MAEPLIVFGSPASQPSRTVYWSCLMEGLPFKLGTREDLEPGQSNPRGQVPWINDGDFVLSEMAAIVCYLADKHGWHDLYPTDVRVRALIHQFLHMHHTLVRGATCKLMAPHVVKPLRGFSSNPLSRVMVADTMKAAWEARDPLEAGGRAVHTIMGFLEEAYFTDDTPYVCRTDAVSLADLACYAEIGQFTFANLFEFGDYPRAQRWLAAMTEVPFFEPIHAFNSTLGDIASSPNSLERMGPALDAGVRALTDTGLVTNRSVSFRQMVLTADAAGTR